MTAVLCNTCVRNQRRAVELYRVWITNGRNIVTVGGLLGISKQAVHRIIQRVELGLPTSCKHLAPPDVTASEFVPDTHRQVAALMLTWRRPLRLRVWLRYNPPSRWPERAKQTAQDQFNGGDPFDLYGYSRGRRLCRTCGWIVPCERCP